MIVGKRKSWGKEEEWGEIIEEGIMITRIEGKKKGNDY